MYAYIYIHTQEPSVDILLSEARKIRDLVGQESYYDYLRQCAVKQILHISEEIRSINDDLRDGAVQAFMRGTCTHVHTYIHSVCDEIYPCVAFFRQTHASIYTYTSIGILM